MNSTLETTVSILIKNKKALKKTIEELKTRNLELEDVLEVVATKVNLLCQAFSELAVFLGQVAGNGFLDDLLKLVSPLELSTPIKNMVSFSSLSDGFFGNDSSNLRLILRK